MVPSSRLAGTGLDGRLSSTCFLTRTTAPSSPEPPSPGLRSQCSTSSTTPSSPASGSPASSSSSRPCPKRSPDLSGNKTGDLLEKIRGWDYGRGILTNGLTLRCLFSRQATQTSTLADLDGEGDLNADYAVRVSKFFEMYKKTLAPAVPGPDPAKPLFKGYQKFDTSVLGSCGDFPSGYVGEEVKPCIFFKLNNIWGWDPKPVQCGDPEKFFEGDGEPFDECPATLTAHLASDAAKEAKGESIWIDRNGGNEQQGDRAPGPEASKHPAGARRQDKEPPPRRHQ